MDTETISKPADSEKHEVCRDFDEDCADIKAEGGCLKCWMYDPMQGYCPYLLGMEP